jgi:hypothetical protein
MEKNVDPWALLREVKDLVGRMEAALVAQKPSETTVRSVKVGALEWQADVPEQKMTWAEAKAYAASLGGGWRLPTRAELLTLVDDTVCEPACSVFPDCPSAWFWTSTPWAGSSSYAWSVYFDYGNANYDDGVSDSNRVRCVR